MAKNVQENDDAVFILLNQPDGEKSYFEKRSSPLPQQMHQLGRGSIKDRENPAKRTSKSMEKPATKERRPEDAKNVREIPAVTAGSSTQKQ